MCVSVCVCVCQCVCVCVCVCECVDCSEDQTEFKIGLSNFHSRYTSCDRP